MLPSICRGTGEPVPASSPNGSNCGRCWRDFPQKPCFAPTPVSSVTTCSAQSPVPKPSSSFASARRTKGDTQFLAQGGEYWVSPFVGCPLLGRRSLQDSAFPGRAWVRVVGAKKLVADWTGKANHLAKCGQLLGVPFLLPTVTMVSARVPRNIAATSSAR